MKRLADTIRSGVTAAYTACLQQFLIIHVDPAVQPHRLRNIPDDYTHHIV